MLSMCCYSQHQENYNKDIIKKKLIEKNIELYIYKKNGSIKE